MTPPSAAVGPPAPAHVLRLLRERFFNRTDVVAILAPWGKPCPIGADGIFEDLVAAHVLGEAAPEVKVQYTNRQGTAAIKDRFRLGSYGPAGDGTTRWLCIDFDGAGHSTPLADPEGTTRATLARFTDAGLPAYLERSGSTTGFHLWCFFDPPLAAASAQALAHALLPRDALLANGGTADPRSGRGIEIFPKQTKIRKGGYGNSMWLPWWSGAPTGGCVLLRPSDGDSGPLEAFVPDAIATASVDAIERVLASVPETPASGARSTTTAAARERLEHLDDEPARVPSASTTPAPSSSSRDWSEWRRRAVAALPLDAIYGAWLTGRSNGPGWLECRDPDSASGDQNPSAGVADGTGEAERGSFHSFISGTTLTVFDFLVEFGRAADFRAARAQVAELSGVPEPTGSPPARATSNAAAAAPTVARATGGTPPPPASPPAISPSRRMPEITINNRQLRDIVADAWRALHAANAPPFLFQRAGALVRLKPTKEGLVIDDVDDAVAFGYLIRVANWVRVTEEGTFDAVPPRDAARDLLAFVDGSLPVLDSIVTAPIFDAEARLIATPGYHRAAELYYDAPPKFELPAVPEAPCDDEIAAALALLFDDLLVDFPFAADADRAHAVSALLLPFIRPFVHRSTPIHMVEAPTPGSGKGLLADLVSVIATGRASEPTTVTSDENETKKKITALLLLGQPIVLLDNLRGGLDSSQVAAAVTAEVWKDRVLGQTKLISLPNRATWLATANNPNLSTEIARRCIRIRLEPKVDRPWERTRFKHEYLRDWALAHRPALVHALLLLVRHWLATGRHLSQRKLGSFEDWAAVMGGILEAAGVEGFLENTHEHYAAADAEGESWRAFVGAWQERFGGADVSAGDLVTLALERDLLGSVLGDKSPRSQATRLGKALTAMRDRHFASFRIEARPRVHNQVHWRLAGEGINTPPAAQTELDLAALGDDDDGDDELP